MRETSREAGPTSSLPASAAPHLRCPPRKAARKCESRALVSRASRSLLEGLGPSLAWPMAAAAQPSPARPALAHSLEAKLLW